MFSKEWWQNHENLVWSNNNYFFLIFLFSFLDKRCLIPYTYTEKPTILDATNTSFTLSLPSVTPQQLCPGILQPTPTYLVFLAQMTNNHRNSSYHLSDLQQKTLVRLFWNKNACGIIYVEECDIFSSHFVNHSVPFNQEVFPLLHPRQ